MFVTSKENIELFICTYNGITASVSLVSSTLIVLNSRLSDWSWRKQKQKTTMVNEWTRRKWRFFQSGTHTWQCSCKSWVIKPIIYVTKHEQKAPINMLTLSKTSKAQEVEGFTQMRIISKYFSHPPTRMVHWRPQKLCLFKFLCKSCRSCKVYNSLSICSRQVELSTIKISHL